MISVGIFTGYYPFAMDEVIRRIKAAEFNCVQLDISFKDFDAAKEPLTLERAHWIRDAFRDANLPIIARFGIHQHHPPQQGKARGEHRLSKAHAPLRARPRLPVCGKRDRHMQL